MTTATRETTFAPTYHFVTDLGTDEAWTNLPGGPSESRFSEWYKVDIPRWIAGEYKRLTPERQRDDATVSVGGHVEPPPTRTLVSITSHRMPAPAQRSHRRPRSASPPLTIPRRSKRPARG